MLDLITSTRFKDARGELDILIETSTVVFKRSRSLKGVSRGLHIQLPPCKQEKYIRVVDGIIMDVCLDLAFSSPRFGKFDFNELRPSFEFFRVQPWYAHGFVCFEDTQFEYVCIGPYNESAEVVIQMPIEIDELFKKFSLTKIASSKDLAGISHSKALEIFSDVNWSLG